eukprot:TRINITY_DN4490_c0_g1_i1.p1 TRINITY_DN4490_c0_g1~~TRINITY_DN4490_c0_g1_i1.p1  ORF type:complete len:353 (+),score=106.07 TRINITY_DN4490_c0_g1_i1:110-1168(+)
MESSENKHRVAIIGSGNWGSAIAKIIGTNVTQSDRFHRDIKMWVFEEMVDGRKLTELINTEHENKKYLPGHKLPENIIATPDLNDAAEDADLLIFVLPHQFLKKTCDDIKDHVRKNPKALSLIKGLDIGPDGPILLSDIIKRELQIDDVSVLMGANIATEVANGVFSEATIGYRNRESAVIFQDLINCSSFRVDIIEDVPGVELCGALKNVVAIAAGFVDGLGLPGNTKAAVMRIGMLEMRKFAKLFYTVQDDTFWQSCGIADLIVTCLEGRNRKCAEAFVRTGMNFSQLEQELLGGQKLQGTTTAYEVYQILSKKNAEHKFPLFTIVYKIAFEGYPVHKMMDSFVIRKHKL